MSSPPPPAALLPSPARPTARVSRTFSARPQNVAEARRYLAALMAGSPASTDAALCLSELVTNAITHSRSARRRGWFTITVDRTAATWRIAVHDAGGPWRPSTVRDGTSHRGLAIVAALAARWDTENSGPAGRAVWFEIDDQPLAEPASPAQPGHQDSAP